MVSNNKSLHIYIHIHPLVAIRSVHLIFLSMVLQYLRPIALLLLLLLTTVLEIAEAAAH